MTARPRRDCWATHPMYLSAKTSSSLFTPTIFIQTRNCSPNSWPGPPAGSRAPSGYGAAQPLAAWKPLPRAYSELESLLQRQDALDSMLQQERNWQAALELQTGAARVVAVSLAAVLL